MKSIIKMNCLLLLLGIGLVSCKKNEFIHQEQNPAPFEKQVSVNELKSLWKGENRVVPGGLFIEGTVIYHSDEQQITRVLIQETGESGIVIETGNISDVELDDKVRISLSGKTLSKQNKLFVLSDVTTIEPIGTGVISPLQATIQEAFENQEKWSATLLTLTNLQIEKTAEDGNVIHYTLTDETGSIKSKVLKVASVVLPEEANFLTGVLTVENGEPYLLIRRQADVDAVKPPEYKIFIEDFENGLYNQVENFNETLITGSWHFNQAFAATGASDLKNGKRSARISGKANTIDKEGYVSPNFDFKGLRSVSFYFAGSTWGEGGYLEDLRKVDVFISKDEGGTWTKIGEASTKRGEFQKFEFEVTSTPKEWVRVKIQNASIMSTATTNRIRINIDDIQFSAIEKE